MRKRFGIPLLFFAWLGCSLPLQAQNVINSRGLLIDHMGRLVAISAADPAYSASNNYVGQMGVLLDASGRVIISTSTPVTAFVFIGLTASLPATCVVGQLSFATDATAGQNIYECTSTNTWTQQTGGGGSPGGSNTQVQFNSSSSFGASVNLTWVSPTLTIGVAGTTTGLLGLASSGSGGSNTITPGTITSAYTTTLPANTGTVSETNFSQNWTASQTFNGHLITGEATKTSSYTGNSTADSGNLIVMNCSSACTYTFNGSPGNGYYGWVESIGSTVATVSLNSLNFNGSSSVPVLISDEAMFFESDGANYFGSAPLVAGSNITLTAAANGLTVTSSGGFTNPMTTLGDIIIENPTGTAARLAGPSTFNTPYFLTNTPVSNAAAAEAWLLPGVAVDTQSSATPAFGGDNATTPDRVHLVLTSNNTTSTATSIAAAAGSTNFASNYALATCNSGGVVNTITPTTSTVNGNATQVLQGKVSAHSPTCAFWWSDNTNWWSGVILPTDANGRLAAEGMPALTGDVTSSAGSLSLTVNQIKGGAVPASAAVLGTNSSAQPIAATPHQVALPLQCADSSGSGTAQSCTTTPSQASLTAGDTFVYSTTTTNSGTGLTVNIDSIGAKSIAIAGASGWTTTLTANIIPANKNLILVYDGTNLDVQQTGTAAAGGGTPCTTTANSLQYDNAGAFGCVTDFTASATTITAAAAGILDLSAATGTPALKMPQAVGGTLVAGTVTANLSSSTVVQNTNSTNNNTSITLGITAPGTSTGQTVLNVNGASTGGDLTDWGTGGTWTNGVLSGQTLVASVLIDGSFVSKGTTAGFIDFPAGTDSGSVAPCNTANSICEEAPTAVPFSYKVIKPGTVNTQPVTGFLYGTNVGNVITQQQINTINIDGYGGSPPSSNTATTVVQQSVIELSEFGINGPPTPPIVGTSFVMSQMGANGTGVVLPVNEGGSGTIGQTTSITSNVSISTTAFSTTTLALPAIPVGSTYSGHCMIPWQQLTAASTVQFGIANSVAPTNEWVSTWMNNDSATVLAFDYTTHVNTTASAITASNTTATAATNYSLMVDFTVQNSNIAPLVVSIWGLTGSGSDALQINAGAYCSWY